MSLLSHHLTDHPARNAAHYLTLLSDIYRAIAGGLHSLGRVSLTWIGLLLALPFLLVGFSLLAIIFYRKVSNLTKQLGRDFLELDKRLTDMQEKARSGKSWADTEALLDYKSYCTIKQNQAVWIEQEKKIRALGEKKPKSVPRIIRPALRPLVNFYLAYSAFNLKQAELLRLYDQISPKGDIFELVPEQELWQRRNKSYEYLI